MSNGEINFDLPTIDVNVIKKNSSINEYEENIILGIIFNPQNGVGILRATRPISCGRCSWVWRKIIMYVSPEEKFHNLPTSLDEYISEYNDINLPKVLDNIVEKIIISIPENKWYGINRWKSAMGV